MHPSPAFLVTITLEKAMLYECVFSYVTPTVGIYLKRTSYFSEPEQEAVLAGWRHGKKWHFLEVYEAFNALTFISDS